VRFDGNNIQGTFSLVPGNAQYSYTRIATPGGNHTIEASEGFIAYVYGYGSGESFGYATGAGLSNLSLDVITANSIGAVIPSDSICLNDITLYTPVTNFEYDAYTWEFGDGTTVTMDDETPVAHQYDRPGSYIFRLSGINTANNCAGANADTEVKVINVINPRLQVRGPRSICPNTERVSYWVESNQHYQNEWFVIGGTIVESYNDSILVDWGETNPGASVKLLSHNEYNCYGDTVLFPVKINIQLDPEAPFGPDSLCVSDVWNVRYYAYFVNGSTYNWHVDNGEIMQGQGTNDIRVQWHSAGTGRLWFDQLAVTDTLCDGISDTLTVFIQPLPDLNAEILTDKREFAIGEPVHLQFESDSMFRKVRLFIDDDLYRDSIPANESMVLNFDCAGSYELTIEAFDAKGVCDVIGSGSLNITVFPPEMEIIKVTNQLDRDSLLTVEWMISQENFFGRSFYLQKQVGGQWQNLEVIDPQVVRYDDVDVLPGSVIYPYRLFTNNDCADDYLSSIHKNILLLADQYSENATNIWWNSYTGWKQGVDRYEIYLSIDDRIPQLLTTTNNTEYNFENDSLGFDYCFRIKAIEKGGNQRFSWSNEVCAQFIPPIYAYNVITPNGDGLNEYFVIYNIELYPNSFLRIFDRWGKLVFEERGYNNNWTGLKNGRPLASGVYFFGLDLNEPRAGQETINGTISILK